MKKIWTFLLLGLFLIGCSLIPIGNGNNWTFRNFDSNGERIYRTGYNNLDEKINYSGGVGFGGSMMMGSEYSCQSCHGSDGRGGTHTMHMTIMDAPDIRLEALLGESGEHNDETDDQHQNDHVDVDDHNIAHANYDIDMFRNAVVFGKHPNGDSLDQYMPRWKLSETDLSDLFIFISSLQ